MYFDVLTQLNIFWQTVRLLEESRYIYFIITVYISVLKARIFEYLQA